jgi:hypothetical protein
MVDRATAGAGSGSGGETPSSRLRRILAVGLEPELYGRIEALLNRSYFEVDRVPRGGSGRLLCAEIAFDLILVRFPLPDMEAGELLAAVRGGGSPCAGSQILLLPDEARLAEAALLVGHGADLVRAADRTGEVLSAIAAGLLHVAPRLASRRMVRLQARLGDGDGQSLCQTADLSISGMFVRTEARYPLGTMLTFELLLPGEREAVAGSAEVVRHVPGGPGLEEGIGLRYVDLRPGSEARLRGFLSRAAAPG